MNLTVNQLDDMLASVCNTMAPGQIYHINTTMLAQILREYDEMRRPARIVVTMEDGIIQSVCSDADREMHAVVIDYHPDGDIEIEQDDDTTENAWVGPLRVFNDKAWVEMAFNHLKEKEKRDA